MDHLNLIRSLAWSFHRTTRIDWNELFSEACLAYYEGLKFYNPEKGAQSTWVFQWIRAELINFCKREAKNKILHGISDWYTTTSLDSFQELFQEAKPRLSPDTKEIVEMVLQDPIRYAVPARKAIGQIRRDLRETKNWVWPRIDVAMRTLRAEFAVSPGK